MKLSDLDDLEKLARETMLSAGLSARTDLAESVLALVDELRKLLAPVEGIDVGPILARAEAAPPPPWTAGERDGCAWVSTTLCRGHAIVQVTPEIAAFIASAREDVPALVLALLAQRAQTEEARAWVRRLTASERVLTCAFCGEAYPPGTPESNHERLVAHVKVCARHPMREAEARLACRQEAHQAARRALERTTDELRAAEKRIGEARSALRSGPANTAITVALEALDGAGEGKR